MYLFMEVMWRIYASVNWAIIGLDNGLSPIRYQAIIGTNSGLLQIKLLGTNFSKILIEIHFFFLFHSRIPVSKCLQTGGYFVSASMF